MLGRVGVWQCMKPFFSKPDSTVQWLIHVNAASWNAFHCTGVLLKTTYFQRHDKKTEYYNSLKIPHLNVTNMLQKTTLDL